MDPGVSSSPWRACSSERSTRVDRAGVARRQGGRSRSCRSSPVSILRWINVVVSWMAPAFESPLVSSIDPGFCRRRTRPVLRRGHPARVPRRESRRGRACGRDDPPCGVLGGVLRLEGHWGILAGAALAPLGCLLVLEGHGRAAWIGAGLAATRRGSASGVARRDSGRGRVRRRGASRSSRSCLAASLVGLAGPRSRSAGSGPASRRRRSRDVRARGPGRRADPCVLAVALASTFRPDSRRSPRQRP